MAEQHTKAFVVAGATKAALLEDFQGALTRALENGTTLAAFRKNSTRSSPSTVGPIRAGGAGGPRHFRDEHSRRPFRRALGPDRAQQEKAALSSVCGRLRPPNPSRA